MTDKDHSAPASASVASLSEQDRKLLAAFHSLKDCPSIESTQDLVNFMTKFHDSEQPQRGECPNRIETRPREERPMMDTWQEPDVRTTIMSTYQHPRISTFCGESGKSDVSWDCFKFEIEALLVEGIYSKEQILQGIRRAVRGEVAEIVRRLGPGASVREVMCKLESTYGNIDTQETIMKKFYSCTQQAGESVTAFAARLEDHFNRGTELGCLSRSDTHILKGVLYQGLRRELKQLSAYKCDTISDYDRFKIELRKIEAEQKEGNNKPCRPATNHSQAGQETSAKSEMGQVKDLLQQLSDRISQLEMQKADPKPDTTTAWRQPAARGAHGSNTRGFRGNRGRGSYQLGRPLASTTFGPTCWGCNRKGHTRANCPNLN